MAKRDQHTDDAAGYPVGGRTGKPHHPDGWFPARDGNGGDDGPMPERGRPPASGTHDRPNED